jgi:hypothetical protein
LEDNHVDEQVHRQEEGRLEDHPHHAQNRSRVPLGELDPRDRDEQAAIFEDDAEHVPRRDEDGAKERHAEIVNS